MPSIIFIPAGKLEAMNQIFGVMSAPRAFIRKCCPANIPNPTWETTTTHYMMLDMTSTPSQEAEMAEMATGQGTLPWIDGEWGENGLPSQAAAEAAIGSANMRVRTAASFGDENEEAERDGWYSDQMNSAFGGLQFVPDEPV